MDDVFATGCGPSLRLGIVTLLLAYVIYAYIERRKEYEADKVFGERHGCMPIQKRLPYKWPLALNVFKKQYDALVARNLLDFQAEYFDKTKMGQTFEVKLLGRIGYFTTDPKNLEAILSTDFEDWGLGSRRPACSGNAYPFFF